MFVVGLAFLIWGVAVYVSARVFPSPVTGVTLADLLAGFVLISIGVSLAIWAIVGARPSEEGTAREMVKVRGEVFPRGYRLDAKVVFFVGLGFFLYGLTTLVLTGVSPPSFVRAIPLQLLWGFIWFGLGGFLASWALIGGRRS